MSDRLATELEQFAAAILAAQQHLLDLLRRKRIAWVSSDMTTVEALQGPETQAAERLQAFIAWRTKLLAKAQQAGLPVQTLTELARRIGAAGPIETLLESSRRTALELQRESWIQWILANRCAQYYRDVIDRIAHGGKRSPTYDRGEPPPAAGGTLLNASA